MEKKVLGNPNIHCLRSIIICCLIHQCDETAGDSLRMFWCCPFIYSNPNMDLKIILSILYSFNKVSLASIKQQTSNVHHTKNLDLYVLWGIMYGIFRCHGALCHCMKYAINTHQKMGSFPCNLLDFAIQFLTYVMKEMALGYF